MNRVRVSKNFYLDELVAPEIYSARGAKSIALLDMRIINGLQWLRDATGRPIIVNNWIHGGQHSESGLRSFNTATGARWSQHKFGRAFDVKVEGMTTSEVHSLIIQNQAILVSRGWITCIEDARDTLTWVHIDCRHTGSNQIVVVRG